MTTIARNHVFSRASGYRCGLQRPLCRVLAATVMPAAAAKRQPLSPQPVVERSASGTIIQPTTTIIPEGNGHNKVIVIPRRRSYLDTGTEVSVGDRKFRDYVTAARRRPRPALLVLWAGRSGHGRHPCRALSTAPALVKHAVLSRFRHSATRPDTRQIGMGSDAKPKWLRFAFRCSSFFEHEPFPTTGATRSGAASTARTTKSFIAAAISSAAISAPIFWCARPMSAGSKSPPRSPSMAS